MADSAQGSLLSVLNSLYPMKEGKENAVRDPSNQIFMWLAATNCCAAYALGTLVHAWGQGRWTTLFGHMGAGLSYQFALAGRSMEGESNDVRVRETIAAGVHVGTAMPRYLERKNMRFVGYSSWYGLFALSFYGSRLYYYSLIEE